MAIPLYQPRLTSPAREAADLLRQLQEEQRRTVSLSQEMTTSTSSRCQAS